MVSVIGSRKCDAAGPGPGGYVRELPTADSPAGGAPSLDRPCSSERRRVSRAGRAASARPRRPLAGKGGRLVELLRQGWYLFVRMSFSSLTRRIIFLNVTGLLALVIGVLYLSHSVPALSMPVSKACWCKAR